MKWTAPNTLELVWSEARRPNMSSLLHYNPVSRCGTILEKIAGFDVMEKAARLFIGAGLEGE